MLLAYGILSLFISCLTNYSFLQFSYGFNSHFPMHMGLQDIEMDGGNGQ